MNTNEQIALGIEALKIHSIKQAFDRLFEPAHTDQKARELFLRIVTSASRMRLLTVDQIALAKREAQKGDALAQYVFGRYHQIFKPDEDSVQKAIDLFEACKDEVPDALCAEAIMILDGHYGTVDRDRYFELLKEAKEKGSSHAIRKMLYDTIHGRNGLEADTQAVIDQVKEYLGDEESDDISKVDPIYYDILGDAYLTQCEKTPAIRYFTKAADMGYYESLWSICIVMGCDSKGEIVDKKAFDLAVDIGCKFMDPACMCFRCDISSNDFEKLSQEEQKEKHQQIDNDLHTAFELGEDLAPYMLGCNYYYGKNGYKQDYKEAWYWFAAGARMESSYCYSMLAEMVQEGEQPDEIDTSGEFLEFCQLSALRRGDNSQLENVVEAYRAGKLSFAATEIEKYYVPNYDESTEDEDEDEEFEDEEFEDEETSEEEDTYEEEDDAPLYKLIAIIQPNKKAYIHEFDVEYWDELPPMIDAKRLDAIRTQPLYDLSEKMGYTKNHITAWVDNMGLLKNLPINPIGCKLYPGDIVGDLILTLEDNKYNPLSFENLDELKQVVADLGAKLENVYLDDGPDDDGRYDAWS